MRAYMVTWAALAVAVTACGGSDDGAIHESGGSGGTTSTGGSAGSVATGGSAGSVATGGSAGSVATGGSAGSAAVDPTGDGPFTTATADGTASVTSTGHSVPVHCVVPNSGPSAAPYPVVLILHGFQLPASQYTGYATRLGSFGYVACLVDYPAGFVANHADNAKDVVGALDWVLESSATVGGALAGLVDDTKVGVMGHSLGGKLSVLAAAQDTRFKAVLGLDPVDTSTLCNPTACPDASEKLPLPIPTAFLGETLDSTAGLGGQACAPAADNYQTFFAKAGSPSVEVTLNGANHMSFIDDVAKCGFTCSVCQTATMPSSDALAIARAYSVAFFESRLRGNAALDSWPSSNGFVTAGSVSVQTK